MSSACATRHLTFLARTDLDAAARLAGYEVVRLRPVGYAPFRLLGLGHLLNWWMPVVPGFRWTSFVVVAVLRPVVRETRRPSLSIVIPARNEIFALGIVDVPICHRARTYGATNIRRFRHGTMLLKMTLLSLFLVRVGPWRIAPGPNRLSRDAQSGSTGLT